MYEGYKIFLRNIVQLEKQNPNLRIENKYFKKQHKSKYFL